MVKDGPDVNDRVINEVTNSANVLLRFQHFVSKETQEKLTTAQTRKERYSVNISVNKDHYKLFYE